MTRRRIGCAAGLLGVLAVALHAPAALASSGGISSLAFGATGCPLCHFGGTAPTVLLSGPTALAPGATADYTLTIFTIPAQNYGGFNVSAPAGTLAVGGPFADGTTNISGTGGRDEITHSTPKQADYLNTVEFSFRFTAPDDFTSVTLRGWGNAVNGSQSPGGDAASLSTLEVVSSSNSPTPTPLPGSCAAATPLSPALLTEAPAQGCQAAIAKAGALYMKKDLKAVRRCLETFQAGTGTGDPFGLCVGTAAAVPGDATTAAAIMKAQAKATALLRAKCPDAAVAGLDACATSEAGLETCFLEQHRRHVAEAIAAEYGDAAPLADKGERKCQKALGDAAAAYLSAQLRASQKCLVRRNKAGTTADGAALCIGALAADAFLPPLDARAAAAAADAAATLAKKLAGKCSAGQIAALDGCGFDQGSALACLLCSHRTTVFSLLSDEFGGAP